VFTEASAVTPEGRISPQDLGIYADGHIAGLARIVRFIHGQKCAAGMQLAHAGRKGSTTPPWQGSTKVDRAAGGWQPVGPTNEPFSPTYPVPCALTVEEIRGVAGAFRAAARRALAAGFDVVEIHAAHGYLIHEFLTPLVNRAPTSTADRSTIACGCVSKSPTPCAASGRIGCQCSSASRRRLGGRRLGYRSMCRAPRRLRDRGIDSVDCSSGGAVPMRRFHSRPGIRSSSPSGSAATPVVATGAVGLITESHQADAIIRGEQADCVLLAREAAARSVLAAALPPESSGIRAVAGAVPAGARGYAARE